MYPKIQKIYRAYVSKQSSKCERQVILLMIRNIEGWHNLAVKKLSALLRGITSKHNDNFYCLSCFIRLEEKLILNHKNVCENNNSFQIVVSSEDIKILQFISIINLIKHHLLAMQILNLNRKDRWM